jgi:hypothetical protein
MSLAGQIAKWTIVALIAFGAIVTIVRVGQPRKPIDPATAAGATVINALILAAILIFWN